MTSAEKFRSIYRLEAGMLKNSKPHMKVMHPLPRVTEIAQDVDATHHAYYFQQARNGLFVRETLASTYPRSSKMIHRTVTIAKIKTGIVIDHIPSGKAYLISQVLGLNALAVKPEISLP